MSADTAVMRRRLPSRSPARAVLPKWIYEREHEEVADDMGFIHEQHGRVAIETRRESFIVHMGYGYDPSGNERDDSLGAFGRHWREMPHPEFLHEDLDDLITALTEIRDRRRGGRP